MKKRLLACLLTAAMLVSLFPLPALAAEAEPYTGGLCHHHQEHSYEVCGYLIIFTALNQKNLSISKSLAC